VLWRDTCTPPSSTVQEKLGSGLHGWLPWHLLGCSPCLTELKIMYPKVVGVFHNASDQ
jgi:hypothetical protein